MNGFCWSRRAFHITGVNLQRNYFFRHAVGYSRNLQVKDLIPEGHSHVILRLVELLEGIFALFFCAICMKQKGKSRFAEFAFL